MFQTYVSCWLPVAYEMPLSGRADVNWIYANGILFPQSFHLLRNVAYYDHVLSCQKFYLLDGCVLMCMQEWGGNTSNYNELWTNAVVEGAHYCDVKPFICICC